jgi:hypothetical protein
MQLGLRISTAVALVFLVFGVISAQAQTQIGDVLVGTCDGTPFNTRLNEADAYAPNGQFRLAFKGAQQNACLTNMTFDAADDLHIISALFGTTNWNLLKFDNSGNLLGTQGPFTTPVSIVHDQAGNFYLGAGSVIKIATNGGVSSFTVAGGAQWVTLLSDQHTLVYSTAAGDVKSYDVSAQTQGPDFALNVQAHAIRMLPDDTLLIDRNGAITRWSPPCKGCHPYKQKIAYQIPANADNLALDPDGVSFWTINTFYDAVNQLGKGDVYRTNILTGAAMESFALTPLPNGRTYAATIGVNGDGMNTTASVTPALTFASRGIGTTSGGQAAVLANTGPVVMTASKFTVTGDFAIKTNRCLKGLLPGASCNITVTFSPTHIGTRTGALTIFENADNSPQTVALSGIGKGTTTTTLTSSLNPSIYGQAITFTAHVTSNGGVVPTGTVSFVDGTKAFGKATLNNGVATLISSNRPAGTLSILAKYSGDAANVKSESPVLTQTVFQATTTTTVTSSVNPSHAGQAVKFTATVLSPTAKPTGSVTFTAGTTTLGTANLSNGKASLTASALPVGNTTVTVTYPGTANIVGSSGSVMQTVQ